MVTSRISCYPFKSKDSPEPHLSNFGPKLLDRLRESVGELSALAKEQRLPSKPEILGRVNQRTSGQHTRADLKETTANCVGRTDAYVCALCVRQGWKTRQIPIDDQLSHWTKQGKYGCRDGSR